MLHGLGTMSTTYFTLIEKGRQSFSASYWVVTLLSQRVHGDCPTLVARFLAVYKAYEGIYYMHSVDR